MDYKFQLEQAFPGLIVNGAVQQPSPLAQAGAQALSLLFMGGIALQFIGGAVLPAHLNEKMNENRMSVIGGIFLCNMLAGQLIATGAFEIFYNGNPVWSKMETNRFPKMHELLEELSGNHQLVLNH